MSDTGLNVSQLFQTAHDEGSLSAQALNVLNMVDVGQQIQAQIGVSGLNAKTSEVLLLAIQPDDSGSIAGINMVDPKTGLTMSGVDAMIDGHNMVLDALKDSGQRDGIEVWTQYLNGYVLNNWTLLEFANRMDHLNYNPMKGTPLYQNAVTLLGSVVARAQMASLDGQVVRSGVLFVTDGHDQHSHNVTAAHVKAVVDSLVADETSIVAFLGIKDGFTDFHRVAREMGVRDNWILTTDSDPTQIRRAFNTFSTTMVRASQAAGAGAFSKVAGGGFTV